ncbi:hypothetical protein NT6N_19690 [Oceaniferula spumae]|uniref:PPM-type phosphatase domain-containing protein n=1 Tax=Oceaniferula spumae TaxID=2979115 RepID=A0AAT9FLT4_9BACT
MPTFQVATAEHTGGRQEQQDSVAYWTNGTQCLAVLADGVGGNTDGKAASQAVIDSAKNLWTREKGLFHAPKDQLTQIAEDAFSAIEQLAPDANRKPASTIVALYVDQKNAHWVHCGDSRLYHLNPSGRVITRTRDHSVVQMLLDQDKITEAELSTHPDKGRILKALGGNSFKGVDYQSSHYQPGDTFLLCSDGYWESIPADQAAFPPTPPNKTLQQHAKQLVERAVQNNGPDSDNTSLAIIHTEGDHRDSASQAAASTSMPSHAAGRNEPPNEKKPLKAFLLILFGIFILFDILLILYLFVLK